MLLIPGTRRVNKGKVEAGVKYVKHNALAGEVFDDWNHLEAYLMDWLETVATAPPARRPGRASSGTSGPR